MIELATGGEVFDRICERGAFSEADAARVVHQVACALGHLHARKICHRDLKPENLLLATADADAPVKLADFGLAAFHDPPHVRMLEEVGTASYSAPEIFEPPPVSLAHGGGVAPGYDKSVDLWSLGCLLYTLLVGHTPFDPSGHDDNVTVRRRVLDAAWSFEAAAAADGGRSGGGAGSGGSGGSGGGGGGTSGGGSIGGGSVGGGSVGGGEGGSGGGGGTSSAAWSGLSDGAKALIRALLSRSPGVRPSADELLQRPWVRGEGAPATPLLGSDAALRNFNEERRVWRAAVNATQLLITSPRSATRFAARPPCADATTAAKPNGASLDAERGETAAEATSPSAPLRWLPPPLRDRSAGELRATFSVRRARAQKAAPGLLFCFPLHPRVHDASRCLPVPAHTLILARACAHRCLPVHVYSGAGGTVCAHTPCAALKLHALRPNSLRLRPNSMRLRPPRALLLSPSPSIPSPPRPSPHSSLTMTPIPTSPPTTSAARAPPSVPPTTTACAPCSAPPLPRAPWRTASSSSSSSVSCWRRWTTRPAAPSGAPLISLIRCAASACPCPRPPCPCPCVGRVGRGVWCV